MKQNTPAAVSRKRHSQKQSPDDIYHLTVLKRLCKPESVTSQALEAAMIVYANILPDVDKERTLFALKESYRYLENGESIWWQEFERQIMNILASNKEVMKMFICCVEKYNIWGTTYK